MQQCLIYNLPRSYRFNQKLADEVKGFAVTPQMLVGAGPPTIGIQIESKSPALFLFDDNSIQEVLPRYGDYLMSCFNEQELTCGTYVAVADVHEKSINTQLPHSMVHYVSTYDAKCVKKDAIPKYFIQYLTRTKYLFSETKNTNGIVNALASAMLYLFEIIGIYHQRVGYKSAHKILLEFLANTTVVQQYIELIDKIITIQANFSEDIWRNDFLPKILMIVEELNHGNGLNEAAEFFFSGL